MAIAEQIELTHCVVEKFRCNKYSEFDLTLFPIMGSDKTTISIKATIHRPEMDDIVTACAHMVERTVTASHSDDTQLMEVEFIDPKNLAPHKNTYPKHDENGFLGLKIAADHIYEFFTSGRLHYHKEYHGSDPSVSRTERG